MTEGYWCFEKAADGEGYEVRVWSPKPPTWTIAIAHWHEVEGGFEAEEVYSIDETNLRFDSLDEAFARIPPEFRDEAANNLRAQIGEEAKTNQATIDRWLASDPKRKA